MSFLERTFAGVNFEEAYNSANRLPPDATEFTTPLALFLIRFSSFFSLSQFVSDINCRMRPNIADAFLSRQALDISRDSWTSPRSKSVDV